MADGGEHAVLSLAMTTSCFRPYSFFAVVLSDFVT